MDNIRLLDFHATWCEPCKWSEPIVDEVVKHFGDKLILEKIDVDQSQELCSLYNIRSVPTFVLLISSKEVWRMNGFDHSANMITAITEAIKKHE